MQQQEDISYSYNDDNESIYEEKGIFYQSTKRNRFQLEAYQYPPIKRMKSYVIYIGSIDNESFSWCLKKNQKLHSGKMRFSDLNCDPVELQAEITRVGLVAALRMHEASIIQRIINKQYYPTNSEIPESIALQGEIGSGSYTIAREFDSINNHTHNNDEDNDKDLAPDNQHKIVLKNKKKLAPLPESINHYRNGRFFPIYTVARILNNRERYLDSNYREALIKYQFLRDTYPYKPLSLFLVSDGYRLVMPKAPGESVACLTFETDQEHIEFALALLNALEACHKNNWVYIDLNLNNIFY
ncbi:MAG TPA: hypothetical protein VHD33_01730, partial [Legionellaceae bacterium]|nr:hypothetical protein [Legionellaceae bacterium]